MENNLDNLLMTLDDEIDKKCFEIKQKKLEKALKSAFVLGCVLFAVIPFALILTGVNLFAILIPLAIFISVSFASLTPLILNYFGGIVR